MGQLFLRGAAGNLPLVSTLSLCSLRSLDGGHYAREKCRELLGAAGGLTTHTHTHIYIYIYTRHIYFQVSETMSEYIVCQGEDHVKKVIFG